MPQLSPVTTSSPFTVTAANLGDRNTRDSSSDALPVLGIDNAPPPDGYAAVEQAIPAELHALTPEQGKLLDAVQREYRRALHPDYAFPSGKLSAPQQRAIDTFHRERTALVAAALHPFPAGNTWREAPALDDCRTAAEVFKRLFAHSAGLVVATPRTGTAAKQVLIQNMIELRNLGVDTLYMDHLQSDVHQADLDALPHSNGLPPALDQFLAGIDYDPLIPASALPGSTYRDLVLAAIRAGLRVVALDQTTSYYLKGAEVPEHLHRQRDMDLRSLVFNHVASHRIKQDRRALPPTPGQRRWMAVVPPRSAGRFNGVDGVAGRCNALSISVQGVPVSPDAATRAGHDPGRPLSPDATGEGGFEQCHRLLTVPQLGGRKPQNTPGPCTAEQAKATREQQEAVKGCADRLDRIGTYDLLTLSSGAHLLVHRSSNRRLVDQPIVRTAGGGFLVQLAPTADLSRWSHAAGEFATLDALCAALETQLERVPPRPRLQE